MRFCTMFTALVACVSATSAAITWSLEKVSNPSADQADAYSRIENAMRLAAARYNRLGGATKTIRVSYVPGVPTADANFNGSLRFGSNRSYMSERTALHEISHTLGIGQTAAFDRKCAANDWRTATPLLQSWDGAGVRINCGGGHIWPYGLNYDNEWSETSANRHVQLVNAMIADGLQG
ncbi:ricin b lectin [Fusarium subglutinans]|uniref:Ricin b lectin n=1 Tax=Gibberella subglutinans TaxID=42677 RepID=A0A8H5PE50_GIBSU|nr:ricin b lectin [Fusarium subglutinans]KAF5595151.1 ricin b lectin [Fusarium subglutinans]